MVQASAAIFFRDGRAEETHVAHLGHDLAVEDFMSIRFKDARHELVLTVLARCIADHAFFIS